MVAHDRRADRNIMIVCYLDESMEDVGTAAGSSSRPLYGRDPDDPAVMVCFT